MVYTLRFFSSSKFSLFHNSNIFGSCFIHILYTGCSKIKKIIPVPKGCVCSGLCVMSVFWLVWVHGYFRWLQFVQCPWLYFLRPKIGFTFSIALFLFLNVDVEVICSQAHIVIRWVFLWYQWLRITRSKGGIKFDALLLEDGSRGGFQKLFFKKF